MWWLLVAWRPFQPRTSATAILSKAGRGVWRVLTVICILCILSLFCVINIPINLLPWCKLSLKKVVQFIFNCMQKSTVHFIYILYYIYMVRFDLQVVDICLVVLSHDTKSCVTHASGQIWNYVGPRYQVKPYLNIESLVWSWPCSLDACCYLKDGYVGEVMHGRH